MKTTYILGIDTAKHKVRAALSGADERFLFEKDLAASAAGLRELLLSLKQFVAEGPQLLVLIEATGVLHLNWAAALAKAGYAVAVINPLMARRLYTVENSLRDNKTDPIDARGLCAIGALHGEKLLAHYRFGLKPEQFALQRLQTVRKALRNALTNLKKTYQSVLELSFPELGALLEVDGVGIRALLGQAPTPAAIARVRLSTLEKNWMLRPKAAALKALAADSLADREPARPVPQPCKPSSRPWARWKRGCAAWINRSKPSPPKAWTQRPKRWWNQCPASVPPLPPKSWLTCPAHSCTLAAIAKWPPVSRPSWATTRGSRKVASGKDKPK